MASSAQAGELEVTVACPAWTPEAAAQVEARIRTSFLAEATEARRVTVSCAAETTSVEVEALGSTVLRPVVRSSGVLEDDVVATAQDALHELARLPNAEVTTEPTPTPTPSVTPPVTDEATSAPAAAKRQPAPAPAGTPAPSRISFQGRAGALAERWGNRWAAGGEASILIGRSRSLRYGLALGGQAATNEPASFAVKEGNASARLQLVPEQAGGLRGELGVGASLLVTSPAAGVVVDSGALLGVAYAELRLSRSFSLGLFALAPSLGARVFSARRNVKVNDQERLAVPVFVPQAALWLIFPADRLFK